ncbi:uncharacterized protein LOC115315264 [Ixodes scapularis]|uniref:uncharacterized protein LOC115315264 n=1 Tax=Ixodes scapularis TaxID=6945 RepID=UPI001AD75FB1|nr:uncharacterized protein LOC115315264 [Ixodes scapularis]
MGSYFPCVDVRRQRLYRQGSSNQSARICSSGTAFTNRTLPFTEGKVYRLALQLVPGTMTSMSWLSPCPRQQRNTTGGTLDHCTVDAVLYPARHCVWLKWPSRGSLHDFYEAPLAIASNRPESWIKPCKMEVLFRPSAFCWIKSCTPFPRVFHIVNCWYFFYDSAHYLPTTFYSRNAVYRDFFYIDPFLCKRHQAVLQFV